MTRFSSEINKPEGTEITLDHVKANQFAMITDLTALSETVRKHLLAYGLFNGHIVRVLSTHPEMIIQIEETELALEHSVAKHILVEIVAKGY